MAETIAHLIFCLFFAGILSGAGWIVGMGLPTGYVFLIFMLVGDLIIKHAELRRELSETD